MSKIKLTNLSVPKAEVQLKEQKATVGATCSIDYNGQPIGNCIDYGEFYRESLLI